MNDQGKFKEDILRQYINPERIEKAPEGFAAKVMTRIQMETVSVKSAGWLRNKNLVPLISIIIIVLLTVAAFMIPGSEDSITMPVAKLFKNINVSIPKVDISQIFRFSLPVWLPYLFPGILLLSFFDRALNGLFRGKNRLKS